MECKVGPKQYTLTDCGIFFCLSVGTYTAGRTFDFRQNDIRRLRKVMAEELSQNQLLPSDLPLPPIIGLKAAPKPELPSVVCRRSPLTLPRQPSLFREHMPPKKPSVKMCINTGTPWDSFNDSDVEFIANNITAGIEQIKKEQLLESPPTVEETEDDWDVLYLAVDPSEVLRLSSVSVEGEDIMEVQKESATKRRCASLDNIEEGQKRRRKHRSSDTRVRKVSIDTGRKTKPTSYVTKF